MSDRTARVARATRETDVTVEVALDGMGRVDAATGVGFFDHMLDALGRHGLLDLTVRAAGDLHVDAHHTVEDAGIVLGQALDEALGDKRGITRMAHAAVPMDEALVLSALDLSGRGGLYWAMDVPMPCALVGDFDAQLAKEFFIALASNARITLHVRELAGENAHHVIEACFKAVGRARRQAVEPDPRMAGELPTTKGAL